jgi:hypothetical protein
MRVKLLIINEYYEVTGQMGGAVGSEVKTRLAPPQEPGVICVLNLTRAVWHKWAGSKSSSL